MNVIVTGAKGFIGKNLVTALKRMENVAVLEYGKDTPANSLEDGIVEADVVYHLAGVNRPEHIQDYATVNTGLTRRICEILCEQKRTPTIVLASSTQAALDNPYGLSKRGAEEAVFRFGDETGARPFVYRLPGVFGKWCRPNYNSVVATFCHNVARDLPLTVNDPGRSLPLVHVGDVVEAFLRHLDGATPGGSIASVEPEFTTTVGDLAAAIQAFRGHRTTLQLPDFSDGFTRRLYSTYVSYLPAEAFAYG